jgi:hypothetical protein
MNYRCQFYTSYRQFIPDDDYVLAFATLHAEVSADFCDNALSVLPGRPNALNLRSVLYIVCYLLCYQLESMRSYPIPTTYASTV